LASLLLGACADPDVEVKIPTPDVPSFESTAYPILLRDCGFPACHGDTRRFFRVFGPGRTRYRPRDITPLLAPPTSEELTASYQRARSMLANDGDIENSPLLQKPLIDGHEGHDEWGRNVYWDKSDPNYQALLNWARSMRPPLVPDAGVPQPGAAPDAALGAGR
jgi:hypothetical protein